MKKLLAILFMLAFLTACGKDKEEEKAPKVQIDFNAPTTGPDPDRLTPSFGPNDPVPEAFDLGLAESPE